MAMQAPKTEATGTSGQSFVKAHFEKLGWGVMPNPEHDLGTDMLVQARDDAGIDLGLLLGVQVKSGPSHFKEPYRKAARWWGGGFVKTRTTSTTGLTTRLRTSLSFTIRTRELPTGSK
jgi:hypothetical protein